MKMVCIRIAVLLTLAAPLAAGDTVDYAKDVKPILATKCFACHGALRQESGLRLDASSLIKQGGDGGSVVVGGDAEASPLFERVASKDQDERMPPIGEGEALNPAQLALVKAWIDQGAVAPDEPIPADPREHWAFRAPTRPNVPQNVDSAWIRNEIDAFVAAKHRELGLKSLPQASKRLLLRRVYLDLIGLPPTRGQMQKFLDDPREDAYERVVDELLDSEHYGERWGRHWMDIWRYTDWCGLGKQLRYSQKHIWNWRDWIIESLNEDEGYDRMIQQMLAADEITPTDQVALRATGFLARNYFLFNRTTWLDNTIEHTSKAFLGLTMNCCKCHDHKYDPLSQHDYYAMRAFFEPHQVRLDTVPGETDLEKAGLPRVFDAHPEAPTYLHIRGNAKDPDKSRVIKPNVPALLAFEELSIHQIDLPAEAFNPALQSFVLENHLQAAEAGITKAEAALAKANEQLAAAKKANSTVKQTAAKSDGESRTEGTLFLEDDFSTANPDVWEAGDGKWTYADGKLIQSQAGAMRAYLRTRQRHPADFQATLRFKTTGGQKWKSVGLCFDVVDGREKMVYMSAVQPGSKVQVSYKTGVDHAYPPAGKQDRPVKTGELYDLTIAVRGSLVNVAIDGQHALAYKLPVRREAGNMDLVAFDATVEFHSILVRELSESVKLVAAGTAADASVPPSLEAARAAVIAAEKALAAAQLRPAALKSAHAADLAKHKNESKQNLDGLVEQAAVAARRYELAKAEEAVARAEQQQLSAADKAKQQSEKNLKTARAKLQAAEKALAAPGTKYESLTASRKALEGPDESDASRRQPYPKISTGRRTALARWIANRKNPLTARVAVNHIWLRHFGRPLVEPVTDFGRRAQQPRHQELLDWLAVEFMENGWSMKHLHRLMVTSQTYRLDASTALADEQTRKKDPENQFYWRRNSIRMQSQVVRDSLLQLAGVLDPAIGGPTIDPRQGDTAYRRSIYFTRSRDHHHKFISMFDDADILQCYRRSESIVPQQALTLANSKLALSMARKIEENWGDGETGGENDEDFARKAFELLLCRVPDVEELDACVEAMKATRQVLTANGRSDIDQRARSSFIHALLNHNDFITIR